MRYLYFRRPKPNDSAETPPKRSANGGMSRTIASPQTVGGYALRPSGTPLIDARYPAIVPARGTGYRYLKPGAWKRLPTLWVLLRIAADTYGTYRVLWAAYALTCHFSYFFLFFLMQQLAPHALDWNSRWLCFEVK